ncbi:MAG: M3 family oligoendopeptidase [bacterium]
MNKNINVEQNRWDLSLMYSGIDDPKIDKDVEALCEKAKTFQISHKGNLSKTLGKAIVDYSDISMLEEKIMVYLYLLQSTNVSDSIVKSKTADIESVVNKAVGEYLAFFDIEINAVDNDTLKKLYENDNIVAKHRPWVEHTRIFKQHLLSEPVESALIKRSSFGAKSWGIFFDELESDLEFDFFGKKRTLTEMLHLMSDSQDKDERFELMTIINNGLKGAFAKYSAQTLYMVTGSGEVEKTERFYKHPMNARNKSNRVSDDVIDILHMVVESVAGPLTKRYYRLKAAHLGLKTLKWSDRNAPMPFSDTTVIPFDEAANMVLEAYRSFSPVMAEIAGSLIKEKRIDVPAVKGKRGGAYNYSAVLPGKISVSYVFLNYLGSNKDVKTLAHELGHAVHGLLAGEAQGVLMSHAPIAFAETASVFGEMTTFNFLKKQLVAKGDKKSLLAIIMNSIDDVINTVVRQISFSNFERRIHGMDKEYKIWGKPKKFSVEELNQIWLETTENLYGKNGEVFTYENMEYLWSYISHFHRPFYVYGYAFGQLLTSGLYAKQSSLGDKFEPLYLDLLRSGSTRNAIELLRPFSLDPTDEKFWTDSINAGLGTLIEEAERLSEEMGIKL